MLGDLCLINIGGSCVTSRNGDCHDQEIAFHAVRWRIVLLRFKCARAWTDVGLHRAVVLQRIFSLERPMYSRATPGSIQLPKYRSLGLCLWIRDDSLFSARD